MSASFLQVPMAATVPSSSRKSLSFRSRSLRSCRCCFNSSFNIPMPPMNPNDPFLSKLAAVAATSPETLLNRPVDSDMPPYLDIFDSPTMMASPAHVESASYEDHMPTEPPPDLPSLLLHGRIVYIGMPLVPAVTELVVAEMMYLQWTDPKQPIYLYVNSTGTTRDDGEPVAMESEGFAIYDAMMQIENEIHTVGLGACIGQGCLLLAAGAKGHRSMMPHTKIMIQQPRVSSSGLIPASDVLIRAKEAVTNRETFIKLLSEHTGTPEETVRNVIRRPFYMNGEKAKEFGVVDKVLWRGQEASIIADVESEEEWERRAIEAGEE